MYLCKTAITVVRHTFVLQPVGITTTQPDAVMSNEH